MDFKEIQKKLVDNALRYGERHGVEINEDFALLKLYEEVGELAQAALIHRKQCRPEKYVSEEESKQMIAHEMADVLGIIAVNAHLFNIDLEDALMQKWIDKKK